MLFAVELPEIHAKERCPESGRGLMDYGDDQLCTYGTRIEVSDSSSAEGPHCWLRLQQDSNVFRTAEAGRAVAHLDVEGARLLSARLLKFVAESSR